MNSSPRSSQTRKSQHNSANRANQGCSTLLLLDVPTGTVIGIDKEKHISGPKFKGIKNIPPGVHILAFNSVGTQGSFSPTLSFFMCLKAGEVLVRRWDASQEMLVPIADEDEAVRFQKGVEQFDFDDGLGPYNYTAHTEWLALTKLIDSQTITRLSPLNGGFISITAEAAPLSASKAEDQLSDQLSKTDLKERSSQASTGGSCEQTGVGRCYYTEIPRHLQVQDRSPSQITAANMDKSKVLESLISHEYAGHGEGVLGELQFAFLAFFIGQSLEGFRQWKRILHLVLSCEAAPLRTHAQLYEKLLDIIKVQLSSSLAQSEIEGQDAEASGPLGIPMVDELLGDSFLRHLFKQFFEVVAEADTSVSSAMQESISTLQAVLEKELGWNFRLEEMREFDSDDEYAPVFVES